MSKQRYPEAVKQITERGHKVDRLSQELQAELSDSCIQGSAEQCRGNV